MRFSWLLVSTAVVLTWPVLTSSLLSSSVDQSFSHGSARADEVEPKANARMLVANLLIAGRRAVKAGKPADARKSFEKAVVLAVSNELNDVDSIVGELLSVAVLLGDEAVLQKYAVCASLTTAKPDIQCAGFFHMGVLSAKHHKVDEAITNFQRAREKARYLSPSVQATWLSWIYESQAQLLLKQKKLADARECYQKAIASASTLPAQKCYAARMSMDLAWVYCLEAKYQKAESLYRQNLKLLRSSRSEMIQPWRYAQLAYCLASQGKLSEALKEVDYALEQPGLTNEQRVALQSQRNDIKSELAKRNLCQHH